MKNDLWSARRPALLLVVAAFALSSCQTVQTTQPGAVGVQRKQSMLLSSQEVNQGAVRAYREELKKAAAKALSRPAACRCAR